jgi:hypothetical protein
MDNKNENRKVTSTYKRKGKVAQDVLLSLWIGNQKIGSAVSISRSRYQFGFNYLVRDFW